MKWKHIFAEALALIAIAGALALAASLQQPKEKSASASRSPSLAGGDLAPSGAGLKNSSDKAERRKLLHSLAPAKDPTLLYLEIQGDMARRLHDAGALFIDARQQESYLESHISKAVNIPVWGSKADEGIRALQNVGAAFDDVIVVYCSGSDCSDSLALSEKLAMNGYLNLYIYKMGFPEWEENGWPLTAGETP
jgi:rhodanese-related sulfurtransferase